MRRSATAVDMARDREGKHPDDPRGRRQVRPGRQRTAAAGQGRRREYDADYFAKGEYKYEDKPIITAQTAASEASDAALQTKIQLAGAVDVNFKSDYLPLDKMATPQMIAAIQGNATPADPERRAERAADRARRLRPPAAARSPPLPRAAAGRLSGSRDGRHDRRTPARPRMVAPPPTSAAARRGAARGRAAADRASPPFSACPTRSARRIAGDMVQVLSYMTDPNGVRTEIAAREASGDLPRSGALAASPVAGGTGRAAPWRDDPVEATKRQLSQSPGFAGKDFEAGAVRQGVEQFGELVQKVDFPKFVGGLIKNVFQAIVESSIEQMRAYGELIANVAKTTDQFMRDNIGEAAGRDWLAEPIPTCSRSASARPPTASPRARRAPRSRRRGWWRKGENAAVRLAEISREMNVNPPVTDLSDANAELRLVTAARLQMAKSRQQLLSSMVMLGINRIVVTDGSINAKVVFDMRASDKAKRDYTASMHDREAQRYKESVKADTAAGSRPLSKSPRSRASRSMSRPSAPRSTRAASPRPR